MFEASDLTIYRDINDGFHETPLAAARNRILAEMIRICHHVPTSSSRNIVAFEYRDVRREPWRAETLMREHVAGIKASPVKALTERGKDDPQQARMGIHVEFGLRRLVTFRSPMYTSSLQAVVEPLRYVHLLGVAIVFFIQFFPKIPTVAPLFHKD